MFERKILGRLYGLKRNEKENTYERITNEELRTIFDELDMGGRSQKQKDKLGAWVGQVWRAEGRTLHEIALWKPDNIYDLKLVSNPFSETSKTIKKSKPVLK